MNPRNFLFNESLNTEFMEDIFLNAEKSIYIVSANIKNFILRKGKKKFSLCWFLSEKLAEGVSVNILAASYSKKFMFEMEKDNLINNKNFFISVCPRVHFKFCVIDDRRAYLGSANFTGAGLGIKSPHRRNFELGVLTSDINVVDMLKENYYNITEGAYCKQCRLKECAGF